MKNNEKVYGHLKDGTPLTDAIANGLVEDAFETLKNGKGRVLKSPGKHIRIKTSAAALPEELQHAAFFR